MSRINIQSSRGTIDLRPVMGRVGPPGQPGQDGQDGLPGAPGYVENLQYMFVVVDGVPYYDPAGPDAGEAGGNVYLDEFGLPVLTALPAVEDEDGAAVLVY